ncbi:MAG: hypothetical protein K2J71_04950, partial [Oscillospiraceae bacterium]|nr:hypothetical protein [Oscillospiraceae bacterium]
AQVANSLFPIAMKFHVILAVIALLVFVIQFVRYRKSHYLLLAVAFPCSLLPYLNPENLTLFHGVGVFEFAALMLSAILSVTIDKDKKSAENSENSENLNNSGEEEIS